MNKTKGLSRPFWRYVFVVFLLLGTIGLGTLSSVFSSWSQLESATPDEATISFETAMALIKDKREYLTISESGMVDVEYKCLHCEYTDHFEALGFEASHQVKVRYSSEREDWIQAMVLAGLGCTVMPEFLPLLPGIATRALVEPEIARTISLVTVAGRRHSPAVGALVRLAQRYPWPR